MLASIQACCLMLEQTYTKGHLFSNSFITIRNKEINSVFEWQLEGMDLPIVPSTTAILMPQSNKIWIRLC